MYLYVCVCVLCLGEDVLVADQLVMYQVYG
jgi:hypothetical protein